MGGYGDCCLLLGSADTLLCKEVWVLDLMSSHLWVESELGSRPAHGYEESDGSTKGHGSKGTFPIHFHLSALKAGFASDFQRVR